MAHELEKADDMVYVGERPWHGLGVPCTSIEEIPDCINWEVETTPIFVASREGDYNEVKSHVAIRRTSDNRVFGIATPDYTPHQNKQLWESFKRFCDAGNMSIETVGALKGGEIIWILARIQADTIHIGGDYDKTNLFALIGSGHNNKLASFTKPTAIRVVCNNTFNVALNDNKYQDRQVHRAEFDVERAAHFVENAILGFKQYEERAQELAEKKVRNHALSIAWSQEVLDEENLDKAITVASNGAFDIDTPKKQWIEHIFSSDSLQSSFEEVLFAKANRPSRQLVEAVGVETAGVEKATWWHEFNGATRYVDHVRSRTPDVRLYNAWFGSGAQIKQKAFEAAIEYAEAA